MKSAFSTTGFMNDLSCELNDIVRNSDLYEWKLGAWLHG